MVSGYLSDWATNSSTYWIGRLSHVGMARIRDSPGLLDFLIAVLRGALGVPCSPKPSRCGTERPPKGVNEIVSVGHAVMIGRVLRGEVVVNRVRSGRKQP